MNVAYGLYEEIDRLRDFADDLDGFLSLLSQKFFDSKRAILREFLKTFRPWGEFYHSIQEVGRLGQPNCFANVNGAVYGITNAYAHTDSLMRSIGNYDLDSMASKAENILHENLLDHSEEVEDE